MPAVCRATEFPPKVAKQNVPSHNCRNNAMKYVGTSSALRPETSARLSRGIHTHTRPDTFLLFEASTFALLTYGILIS
jgi:hypothetical protein